MPENIKASIERLFHKIPAMKFPLICMSNFQSIYHFTVSTHCMHFLPGAPLTAGSGAFIFVTQTGFAGIILLLMVFQTTGRRGTFSFYIITYKSAPMLISGWFGKGFTFMLLTLHDGTTAQL